MPMPSWRHALPVHKLSSIEDQRRTMGSTLEKLRQLPFVTLARAGARLLHPSVACVLLRDRLNWRSRPHSSRCHLDATMEWICRAHEQCGGKGVSLGFSLLRGWFPPYPETTGYIIPTLFDYAKLTGKDEHRMRQPVEEAEENLSTQDLRGRLKVRVAQAWLHPLRRRTSIAQP